MAPLETGSDRAASPQSGEQQPPSDAAAAPETHQQFMNNLRQVAMHPSPDPIDTVTTGLFFWSARQ